MPTQITTRLMVKNIELIILICSSKSRLSWHLLLRFCQPWGSCSWTQLLHLTSNRNMASALSWSELSLQPTRYSTWYFAQFVALSQSRSRTIKYCSSEDASFKDYLSSFWALIRSCCFRWKNDSGYQSSRTRLWASRLPSSISRSSRNF